MFRNIMNDLATWYEIGENKAALIRGGKFVGKTWAALDFATGFFDEHILINLEQYPDFCQYISKERKPERNLSIGWKQQNSIRLGGTVCR